MSEAIVAKPKRLGVLGTLVQDTIHHPGASRPVQDWGGIAYALAALDAVPPPGWTLVPVIKAGGDLFDEASAYLRTFARIGDTSFVRRVPEPNNRVELFYSTPADRTEILSGGVPGWTPGELAEILPRLDALYVNLIAGWELDLDGAHRIRDEFAGPTYVDLHSLFLDMPGGGHRRPRRLPRDEDWAGCFDTVQMNQVEFALFAGGADEHPGAVEEALAARAERIIVTLGADGVEIMTATGPDGGVETERVPVAAGPAPGDPTGCGDIWGSTFFASLLGGAGPHAAIARAHGMARKKLGSSGPDAFRASLAAAESSSASPEPMTRS